MKKYEFTGKEIKHFGRTLKQIVCVTEFSGISVGDIGGYIECESNLSHNDNAWVYDNARVCGNAWVYDNARVCGNAWVYDNARVYGNADVYDNARVCGNARVYDNAWMCGNARVYDNAWVCGNAGVYGNAWVFGNAGVYDNARVCGDARVCGNAEVCTLKAFTISTDMHHVTITDTHITIGCQNHKIDFWRKASSEDIEKIDCKEGGENFMKYKDFIISLADQRNKNLNKED